MRKVEFMHDSERARVRQFFAYTTARDIARQSCKGLTPSVSATDKAAYELASSCLHLPYHLLVSHAATGKVVAAVPCSPCCLLLPAPPPLHVTERASCLPHPAPAAKSTAVDTSFHRKDCCRGNSARPSQQQGGPAPAAAAAAGDGRRRQRQHGAAGCPRRSHGH